MYCLEVIKSINAARAPRAENAFTRASSFVRSRGGVVLHSASLRSTGYLSEPAEVASFLRRASRIRKQETLNRLVESYF